MSSLVEAKNMYLRKLVQILSPEIYSGFKTMYNNILSFCKKNELKEVVFYFQKELEKIPNWNRDRLTEETMKIQAKSDCDYLLDIITTLLMVNMRILLDDSNSTIDIDIPQLYMFIHKCYMLVGAELWSNPELMIDKGSSSERQKNYTFVMKLIQQGINDAIQFYLPMKPILNKYLRNRQEIVGDDDLSFEEESDNEQDYEQSTTTQPPSLEEETERQDSTFFDDASSDIDISVENE